MTSNEGYRMAETPPMLEADPSLNASELLASRAAATPDLPLFALPDGEGWREVSAGEFLADVVAVAKGLVARGVEP